MPLDLALCLKAQKQNSAAYECARPKFQVRYDLPTPAVGTIAPARRAFTDLLKRQTFLPTDPTVYSKTRKPI